MASPPRPALRPTVARVNLSAIADNFCRLKTVVSPAEICAVVKADAYGHGAGPVARRLEAQGCRRFAVATVDEGLDLREEGVSGDILVLQGVPPTHLPLLLETRLTPVVSDLEDLEWFGREVARLGISFGVHIKFDTGMGRFGLWPHEATAVSAVLRRHSGLRLEGVATHLARAGESAEVTRDQLHLFADILGTLRDLGLSPPLIHAANSAACLVEPASHYNCVRLGLAIYGAAPEPGLADLARSIGLRPAMEWVSAIEQVREVPCGTAVSYGGTFVAARPTRLALVPVGYGDGYRRSLGNRGQVLVRGRRVPAVGRVCMDVTLVDVTDVPEAARGDEVVLLGTQGQASISAEDMACWLDTIPYEVFCGVGVRVPRVYGELG